MNPWYELCRCGHILYHHVWVPDPATFGQVPERRDCSSCCCQGFDGTGQFDLTDSPLVGGGRTRSGLSHDSKENR